MHAVFKAGVIVTALVAAPLAAEAGRAEGAGIGAGAGAVVAGPPGAVVGGVIGYYVGGPNIFTADARVGATTGAAAAARRWPDIDDPTGACSRGQVQITRSDQRLAAQLEHRSAPHRSCWLNCLPLRPVRAT
jgi:hypothetical protein